MSELTKEENYHRIAILASGSGSNAQVLIDKFSHNDSISVEYVGSNKLSAGVLARAKTANIEHGHFTREDLETGKLQEIFEKLKIDWILLAGFLLRIPVELCVKYEGRILNIHPSLLPKYGGKGMFGIKVHEAVFESKDSESGMTIHLVNEKYDDGAIVFQAKVNVEDISSPKELAKKVLELEHEYYFRIAEDMIMKL